MSGQNVYVIADTHFGHKKLAELREFKSVKDHDDFIIDRWNSVVKKHDVVYHLGDVCFGVESFKCLGKLKGVKKLVMGNHDSYPIARYAEHFTKISGVMIFDDCVLTHIPVHPQQLDRRFRMNVHGHLHTAKLGDPRYACVSAEHLGLTPTLMRDVTRHSSTFTKGST